MHVQKFLEKNKSISEVSLTLNVDGLNLTKSTNSQIWPILAYATEPSGKHISPVFAIGIFHGHSKPSINENFRELVEEIQALKDFMYLDKPIKINIRAFVCDAPAKSFCTGVKNYNAYSGCSKCCQEGEYVENRVTFPDMSSPLRTDDAFKNHTDEYHHKYISPLEALSFGMVSSFPLDYMHLVCLGVMKKMIGYWMSGPLKCRLSGNMIKKINKRILNFSKHLPGEFNRKLRPITEYVRWKATDLRSFCLYYGQFVLTGILNSDFYQHFLQLNVAEHTHFPTNATQHKYSR